MTVQLSKAQIEAIKVELAKVGLNVTVKRQEAPWYRQPNGAKPKTVGQVLAKSKWYKPASLSTKSCRTTARNLNPRIWEAMKAEPHIYGLCFPYKS